MKTHVEHVFSVIKIKKIKHNSRHSIETPGEEFHFKPCNVYNDGLTSTQGVRLYTHLTVPMYAGLIYAYYVLYISCICIKMFVAHLVLEYIYNILLY